MPEPRFKCPGLSMQQPKDAPPEGYVSCYRAGHKCEVAVEYDADGKGSRTFCGCCGTRYFSVRMPDGGAPDA